MTGLCTEPGCTDPVKARGWCSTHYQRWWRHGDTTDHRARDPGTCTEPDCSEPVKARGWCNLHYARYRRYGDPATPPRIRPAGAGTLLPNGRIVVRVKDHPLTAGRATTIYLHRKILFDTVGPADQPCHWCRIRLAWFPPPGTRNPQLNVVQLDGDYTVTDVTRLVPACMACTIRERRHSARQ